MINAYSVNKPLEPMPAKPHPGLCDFRPAPRVNSEESAMRSHKETPINTPKDTLPSFRLHTPPPAVSVVLTYLMNYIASGNARAVETNGMASGLEQKPFAIIAVAGARVYHTKLQQKDNQWNYSHWKGTLTLGRDLDTPETLAQGTSEAEKHWFRLADVESGRTVWMFKFPENFEYELDRPFFHVFQGRVCSYTL